MHYIVLLLFLIMSAGCVTTGSTIGTIPEVEIVTQPVSNSPEPPDWILGRGHKQFTHAQYLVGIGFSDRNTVSASESARAELAKNIRFKIASIMKDYNSNDGSFVETFIKIETDALLEGVQIKDGWYDPVKKVFYSFVVVKRKDVLTTIQDQIDTVMANSQLTMTQADSFYDDNEILKSLVYYYDGYNESSKLLPLLRTYKTVNLFPEVPVVSSGVPSAIDFKQKVQMIIGNIEVEKITDNVSIQSKDVSFVVKITYDGKALSNLPIKFHGNSYNFVSRVLSDANGVCEVKTNSAILLDENNFAIVKAEIDLFALSKRFNYKLKKDLFGRLETLDVTFKKFKEHKFQFSLDNALTWNGFWTTKSAFEIGEAVVFFVESDVAGYLVIETQKHQNEVSSKIFPNHMMRDNYIAQNKVYNIGGAGYEFKFVVKAPVGREFVKATLYKDEDLSHVVSERTITYNIVTTILPPYIKKGE